jgi:hypothetical protein
MHEFLKASNLYDELLIKYIANLHTKTRLNIYQIKQLLYILSLLSIMTWRHMGKWRYRSTVLHLGTRWWTVSASLPGRFKPRRKSPRYPLDRRLGGPQSRYGRCSVEKKFCHARNRYTNWTTVRPHIAIWGSVWYSGGMTQLNMGKVTNVSEEHSSLFSRRWKQ